VQCWNNLPAHSENVSSLAAFKRLLHISVDIHRVTLNCIYDYLRLSDRGAEYDHLSP